MSDFKTIKGSGPPRTFRFYSRTIREVIMAAKKLLTTIREGDRLASLRAVRDKLAGELEQAPGREAAPLAKELRAVLAEIDSMAPPEEGSRFDELAARRANRLADAEDSPGAGRKRGRRPRSGGTG
jgi:hypothetical protein